MRIKRRIKSMVIAIMALTMLLGITSQATITITQRQRIFLAGTSGSVWQNESKGRRGPNNLSESLYSGIKTTSQTSYRYGNPAGGNVVYLTAYSPTLVGRSSQMQGNAMVQ